MPLEKSPYADKLLELQPGFDCHYLGHKIDPILKGLAHPFPVVCKEKAAGAKIDESHVKDAIIACQFVYDFWASPQFLAPFYKDNRDGPVTLTKEYIDWLKTKKADDLLPGGKDAEEWGEWQMELKQAQQARRDSGRYTIRTDGSKSRKSGEGAGAPRPRQSVPGRAPVEVVDVPGLGEGGGAPAAVQPRAPAPARSGPVTGVDKHVRATEEQKKVMLVPRHVYRGVVNGKVKYILLEKTNTQVDQEERAALEKLGFVNYKQSIEYIFGGDERNKEQFKAAASIFSQHNYVAKHWRLMQVVYKNSMLDPLPSRITIDGEEIDTGRFNNRLVPEAMLEMRVQSIAANHDDNGRPSFATFLEKSWESYQNEDHKEIYFEKLGKHKKAAALLATFEDREQNLYPTAEFLLSRHEEAKALIAEKILDEGVYTNHMLDAGSAFVEQSGCRGETLGSEDYVRDVMQALQVIQPDVHTAENVSNYLAKRRELVDMVGKVRDPAVNVAFVMNFERDHNGKSFKSMFEDLPGIWEAIKDTYELVKGTIASTRAEAERAAAAKEEAAKQENEKLQAEIVRLRQALQAGGIRAEPGEASDQEEGPQGGEGGAAPPAALPWPRKSAMKQKGSAKKRGRSARASRESSPPVPDPASEPIDLRSCATSRVGSPGPESRRSERARTPTKHFKPHRSDN